MARQENPHESFDELTDTPFDFSAFVMNRLNVETLTPELLAGLTFELMKGTCKSLVELEYFFEEVYRATTEQFNWHNPKGQQYPHDLRKLLPLIPNSRGRQVIPFDHFINNDLAYLCGGVSSRTYETSVTKTKAADYSHIKWIKELVPNAMWSQTNVNYDKYTLWGISHWGRKCKQFYGFDVNREFAHDVYSRRRIIAVTKLQIVEWHGYKHLDWITVRRDDDKLHTFKEGDFKRLCLQDIKDMRVEDLQLGVKSYQKKLNITKPDSYRSDLKQREAYFAYSNPRGFIYQNQDKKNKLIHVDELHKFSDGTLNDVRTALDDRLKGIRMEYLPQTIWRQSNRERAKAMIQAIDKQLKSRRIMRSLERFVGGRPYEERFYTLAGNHVKEILLKLNLPDHRIRKDGGEVLKSKNSRSFRHSDTERLSQSDEVLNLKNFKKDATLKLSKSINQEWYIMSSRSHRDHKIQSLKMEKRDYAG
ncbi:hypothetical protein Tco_0712772 [Tanacetum coccineum]